MSIKTLMKEFVKAPKIKNKAHILQMALHSIYQWTQLPENYDRVG